MRCRYCGNESNLITMPWEDEDGFVSDEPVNLCHNCVDHDYERSQARKEWCEYHPDEPCPEGELPQPGPQRSRQHI